MNIFKFWFPFVFLFLINILLFTGACAPRTTSIGLEAEELALIAVEINENPADFEDILDKHELTYEQLERAIREVAENPGLARKYSEIYEEKTN